MGQGEPSDHRFPFEKVAKLDSPERHASQPPDPVVAALAIQPDNRILDLGVGTGYFALPVARELSARGGTGRVLGLDLEPKMLEILVERATADGLDPWIAAILVDQAAPHRLPLDDGSVDRALLASLYHEVADRPSTLHEVGRVLRPDGSLVIVDWDTGGTTEKGPPLAHRVPVDVVEQELNAAGFVETTRLALYDDFYTVRARWPG
jgi:ubiquinone/menaquinone biosynthesis C-methylase UbiE